MPNNNVNHLFQGHPPSIEEIANFGLACSQLSSQQLYDVAIGFADMHWILKKTVLKHLEEKIQAENREMTNDALTKAIVEKLTRHE